MVMLHCGGVLMEGRNVVDYRFLANFTDTIPVKRYCDIFKTLCYKL